jgi:hypothetical protein
MPKRRDLNRSVKRGKKHHVFGQTEVWLDDILEHLLHELSRCDEVHCCVAWLTHPKLLKKLQTMQGVRVVVTADKTNRRFRKQYKSLPRLPGDKVAVKVLGSTRKGRSMMHHKFCVGLCKGIPLFVTTGSFNWSVSACNALENVVCLRNVALARCFLDEHASVWKAARKW